jgi:PhzF family phenazine biosynthesis protein
MNIPLYQIDTFTGELFKGNPAAVCLLDHWLEDSLLQAIAQENNLSETAFIVAEIEGFAIRWFTPVAEVDLCGHATLAASFVIMDILKRPDPRIVFSSKSGKLTVTRNKEFFTLDFPVQTAEACGVPKLLLEGLGKSPLEVLAAADYMAVFGSEKEIVDLQPDLEALKKLDRRGVIVTAQGDGVDFVCRFFAPRVGIDEDPVTGSAYCALMPYWSKKLQNNRLNSHQLSKRGGELFCSIRDDRVMISGRAVKFMEGQISLS